MSLDRVSRSERLIQKARVAVLSTLALLLAGVCSAQIRRGTVEISPFAGYLFGGNFPRGSNALFNFDVDVGDHATYGARLGYNLTSKIQVEVQFSRTETAFVRGRDRELFGSSSRRKLGDLKIDYVLGYGTFNFGHWRAVPYVTLGMGVARLDASRVVCARAPCPDPRVEDRFTASLGVGVKTFMNPHFGFRFDGRYYGTSLRNSRDDRCDRFFDTCSNRHDWLSNGDITGGLVFAF